MVVGYGDRRLAPIGPGGNPLMRLSVDPNIHGVEAKVLLISAAECSSMV